MQNNNKPVSKTHSGRYLLFTLGQGHFAVSFLAPFQVGVIVDSVDSVSVLQTKPFEGNCDFESNLKKDWILGVAQREKTLTLVIDLRAMLVTQETQFIEDQSTGLLAV